MAKRQKRAQLAPCRVPAEITAWVATLDPSVSARFQEHFGRAQEAVASGVTPSNARAAVGMWEQWLIFCDELSLDPFLSSFADKVPLLQVFLWRVRSGELAILGDPIRARSAEAYVRAVAQAFLAIGEDDPRLNSAHKTDYRLARMWAGWKKEDPAPDRVKPVPISVLRHLALVAQSTPPGPGVEKMRATVDMIILAFFFLLRPGEYTDAPSPDAAPFRLSSVQLAIGGRRLDLARERDTVLMLAQTVSLTFDNQKNGVRSEVIRQGRSGDPYLCPVLAASRRVRHLRSHGAPPSAPLARVFTNDGQPPTGVTPTLITRALRSAVTFLGPSLGFLAGEVSARSLRAAGAMALLVADVDPDIIQILGRWRSDEMMRYLHLTAEPIMKDFAKKMLAADFTLAPSQLVPCRR